MAEISDIEVEYDEHSHHADATVTIDGTDYTVRCNGLSSCGEPVCDEINPFEPLDEFGSTSEEYEAWQEMRDAAISEVRKHWNYNGSQWSEPVNEPDDEPSDDNTLPVVVHRSEFHGGDLIGYFDDEESAQAWVDWKNQGTDCICGCYVISENENDDDE